ncbi:MAG: carbohydrate kinase family protein, partial [Acidimicrobiia bacterium]
MTWADRWVRALDSPRLLIVGGASLDRIHVAGEAVDTPGGAGLYTALAAARAGIGVTMLAPLPDPMPPELAPAAELIRWVGPQVGSDGLPRFEIAYDENGSVVQFREHLGAEPDMTPALLDLVDDLPATAYCVPFMNARLQRSFVEALRARGCLTVAATYGKAARSDTELVRSTLEQADLSFCNVDEAEVLFANDAAPPVGHLRFVTRGRSGATVFQGDHRTDVVGEHADAVDPTGAGDTFCGTTIARLLLGDHPVAAARCANAAAARMVTEVGPAALLRPGHPPLPTRDARVRVDEGAVERLAGLIAGLDDLRPFAFAGELFPPVGDPAAVEWFTTATLQQFGFWHENDGVWDRSMIARIDGYDRKGSDYLWAAYHRWATVDPDAMSPQQQARVTIEQWHRVVADDDGRDPFPEPHRYAALARDHGRTLVELGLT